MEYAIAFLEGIITFISPCLLPMLPIYVSYFAGGEVTNGKKKTIKNALGFILGFTTVFVLMGAFAGTLGSFLTKYQTVVNVISGLLVIYFGLSFMGVFKKSIFSGGAKSFNTSNLGFLSSLLFGMVFSIGWTPCVGAFLGSALLMASQQGSMLKGVLMLLLYSVGLGIPFLLSAVLIEKLKTTFDFIKKNYKIINRVCGILLVVVGVLMISGGFGYFLNLFTPK